MTLSRRDLIATAAAGGTMLATNAAAQSGPQPVQGGQGAPIIGPRNPAREAEDPNTISPPSTDHGTIPNLKWSFADSHMRLEEGGWARQTTTRELPISKEMAGVNMRLKHYVVREMHWHKEAEWAFILKGSARITAVDQEGRTFADDVHAGDLWYFPGGIPHSIQGLPSADIDGVEFLLVFDDGDFSEDSTFLLTDWLAHTPRDVLAKNLGVTEDQLAPLPKKELYIFPGAPPSPTLAGDTMHGNGKVPESFSHRMTAQAPIKLKGGEVRITDTRQFPASKTISAALVDLEPGALRELHWHPNGDEWQYYIEGQGRMTVFASESKARTFDYQAGDVGYVPRAMGHYIENTGTTRLRFLEVFRAPLFQDLSLTQWLALTPHQLVQSHLKIDRALIDGLPATKQLVVR
ncbi:oxalate decarboxylase family bicupin [Sphingomonas sp. CROZ-RG-20F-R02-07]|uniref:oxalate decarboxylase family bicupin n=1 Tax=Sphingomonas sp. CROZ-RG-20F-R02-07 TaxID=2914832 RepID=UPI001F572E93|nr:oxalate decarboxylase family bicupin [Sphingomonas sp. CROZ-RG-20F-R02-07]